MLFPCILKASWGRHLHRDLLEYDKIYRGWVGPREILLDPRKGQNHPNFRQTVDTCVTYLVLLLASTPRPKGLAVLGFLWLSCSYGISRPAFALLCLTSFAQWPTGEAWLALCMVGLALTEFGLLGR
jgi:hypothetical protein